MSYQPGDEIQFRPGHDRAAQAGQVTKVKGPKTVEVQMASGFMLWNVKIADIEPLQRAVIFPEFDPFANFPNKGF